MKLKEYLDREPSGEAFLDIVDWLKTIRRNGSDRPIYPAELNSAIAQAISARGGNTKGIINAEAYISLPGFRFKF